MIVAFLPAAAWADDQCPKLNLVASVGMHIGDDGRAYVPMTVAGVSKSMLIDTGGFFTQMTQAGADELKLSPYKTRAQLIGVTGDIASMAVRASFKLDSLYSDEMDFVILAPVHNFADDVPDAVGIIAPNLLRIYDADFDFGNNKFNLISQDHCDGRVIYWTSDNVAVVPMRINQAGHITLQVNIDGHDLPAILDTGASHSVMNLNTAELEFGIVPGATDTPVAGHMFADGSGTIYRHQFKSLALEGLAVGNPTMEIVPDMMGRKQTDPADSIEHDTRIHDRSFERGLPQVIVGMDVLRKLHVYIAYKEQKIYITGAKPAKSTAATTTQ